MGWDISYHPISEEQMQTWYFDVLENKAQIADIASKNGIEEFYQQKYGDTINVALETKADDIFEHTHGYYVAVIQGFFEKYFYVRGGALSFAESDVLQKYFKPWEAIIPENRFAQKILNHIVANYSSGVYIPKQKVKQLLNDYQNDALIKSTLDELFSHGRMAVFLKALAYAEGKGLGLLEATEVVEPNPLDLNSSSCYSNLYKCDPEGAHLYQETAMAQFAEIEQREGLAEGTIINNAEHVVTHIEPEKPKEEKGFWSKLFGK
ncbi:hypothetical protein [Pedobacter agri]|uniref:hypothetical protein n=1 Tax=Pedobacter agri TaxID=454586 RepID=UPI00292D180B|nr:hypothetical protein [Pedobacter agri]